MIYENDIVRVETEIDNSLLVIRWKDKCGNILEDKHEKEYETIREITEANYPRKLLVDLHQCQYFEKPGLPGWVDHPLFRDYIHLGFKKLAFVVPENLFQQVSLEANKLSMMENNTQIQYFKEEGKARSFLIEF